MYRRAGFDVWRLGVKGDSVYCLFKVRFQGQSFHASLSIVDIVEMPE
jgi:hypothetical protein